MFLNKNIRLLREKKGLNQQGLADLIEKKRNTISGYESGDSYPSFNDLIKLAKALEVGLDDLVFRNFDNSETIAAEPNVPYSTKPSAAINQDDDLVIVVPGIKKLQKEYEELQKEVVALKAALKSIKKE